MLGGAGDLLLETDPVGTPRAGYSRGGDLAWEADVGAWGDVQRTRTAPSGAGDPLRILTTAGVPERAKRKAINKAYRHFYGG